MSKKCKTPLETVNGAEPDDEIVFAVRCKRSKISITSGRLLYCGAENIVSAEVIRPLQVGDRIAHKERPKMSRESRLIRATTEIDGELFVGFRSFRESEDRFDPTDAEHDGLAFSPAKHYERVEE